ncbi:hypothetical protein [Segetibacter aerophilus]|uniref:Uncharacterized protein n=1 Tax=Segetibacter aerophilus TaxID=670293 RepID=A0A512B9Z9_9BACT|nr:hypothetical protein [Segetibacter aerophilus]GEO08782.1 hypothetical protein SAE01_12780 [Segetibacter aerophilus]
MKQDWAAFLKDWANLITWMIAFFAIAWKGLNTAEKISNNWVKGAVKIREEIEEIKKEMKEKGKEMERQDRRFEEHQAEILSLKTLVKEMGNRMWDFLKNKHE